MVCCTAEQPKQMGLDTFSTEGYEKIQHIY